VKILNLEHKIYVGSAFINGKYYLLRNEINDIIYHHSSRNDYESITNGHLLICDWCFRILKGSKMQSLDSDKRCC